jgi:hypothetical protein
MTRLLREEAAFSVAKFPSNNWKTDSVQNGWTEFKLSVNTTKKRWIELINPLT